MIWFGLYDVESPDDKALFLRASCIYESSFLNEPSQSIHKLKNELCIFPFLGIKKSFCSMLKIIYQFFRMEN